MIPNHYGAHTKEDSSTASLLKNDETPAVTISIDCPVSSSTTVMPDTGRLYELSILSNQENGGVNLGYRYGPSGTEVRLTPTIQPIHRCQVINRGTVPIFNIEMAVHLMFKAGIRDSENPNSTHSGDITRKRDAVFVINTIEVGLSGFVFYIVNDNPQFVLVTLPQFVSFKKANRDARETAPLIQPPRFTMYYSPRQS